MPDAVLVQGVQRGVGGVRARFLVQVLEALAGGEAAVGALLGDVQLPPEGQCALALLVGEQHWAAVVALGNSPAQHPPASSQSTIHPVSPVQTHRGHQAVFGDEGDSQEGQGLGAQGGDATREGQGVTRELSLES